MSKTERIAEELAQLEESISTEIEQANGVYPSYLYDMIARAYKLALKLR